VTTKKKAPVARPARQTPIDRKVVEGMASVGATNCEIADFLGVSEALVRKRCQDELTKARASLRTRLRQAQIKAALAGNPAMLIWLGKQMLEQRDKQDVTHAGAVNTRGVLVVPGAITADQWAVAAEAQQAALLEQKRAIGAHHGVAR
jgi:hypothetical protein